MNEDGIVYLSSEETAKRWGISDRRVRVLCENGQIAGAIRNGKIWKIPVSAEKPRDGRTMRSLGIPVALRGIISQIDSLKEQLAAKRPLTDGEREQLRNSFLVDYTYSSNAIEGNTLTLSETAMVLAGMTIGEKPLKDHLETTGHRDAFCFLEGFVKSGEAVSESFVRQLHALVLSDKPMDRGVYRRIPVVITGAVHTPPQPYMVAPMMEEWERDLLNKNALFGKKRLRKVFSRFSTMPVFWPKKFPLNATGKVDQRKLHTDMLMKLRMRELEGELQKGVTVSSVSIKNTSYAIDPLVSMIESYALQFGFDVRRARRIRLASEEMLIERIVNAFDDVGDIHLDFECHRDFLRLTFRDSGQPYDFEKQRKISDSAKIMAFAADDLSITKDADGNNNYNLDFLFNSDLDIKNFLATHERLL